jgi:hypothetical protein
MVRERRAIPRSHRSDASETVTEVRVAVVLAWLAVTPGTALQTPKLRVHLVSDVFVGTTTADD